MLIQHLNNELKNFNLSKECVITFIPYDNGSRIPGARMGPNTLYNYLSNKSSLQQFKNIKKSFSVPILNTNSKLTYNNIEEWLSKVFINKNFPVSVGGDHSITLPIVNSYLKHVSTNLNILIFDGHHDFDKSPTLKNWNVVYELANVSNKLVVVGCRDYPNEKVPNNVQIITMDHIDSNVQLPEKILSFLDTKVPLYLSLDLDVIDPSEFPGVSYPVPGGLTYRELKRVFLHVLSTYDLVAVDLVEFNPMIEEHQSVAVIESLLTLLDRERRMWNV